jgi:hypothetical protein
LPLIRPLKSCRKHRCKETADRVFGLLGICSEKIPIDYNGSPRSAAIDILVYLIPKEPSTLADTSGCITYEMNRTGRVADARMKPGI